MMKKLVLIVLCLLGEHCLFAQTKTIYITQAEQEIALLPQTSFWLDATGSASIQAILGGVPFKALDMPKISFGDNQSYLWLRFVVNNQSNIPRTFSIVTKGIDSLFCFQLSDSTKNIIKSSLTGSHIPLSKREFASPYLTFTFDLLPHQTCPMYVRVKNVNYSLSASPFLLFSSEACKKYIKQKDLLQSIYIGSMLFLLLFGTALLIFFQEWLYFYYLLCVLFSVSMMLVYNDYHWLIFDTIPAIIQNKNFFGIPTTLIPAFYLFFAKEFLDYGYDKNGNLKLFTKIVSGAAIIVVFVFLIFQLNFYQNRYVIYGFIFANCFLTLTLLYRSLARGYKPAWLFLIATVPVLLMGFWETLSDIHHTPVQDIHAYYYASTIFEMYVLTLGIALKFKIAQDEKKKLQAEVFAIETQVQENERQRIAQDLHDKLGGSLAALRINISNLSNNNHLDTNEVESLERSLEMIDHTSEEVRNISHSLASSTLTKLGLVPMLLEMYHGSENPKVLIQNNGFINRLSQTKEMTLYAIVQECINNALKHAQASEIAISFKQNNEKLTVMIEDDGKGFDMNHISLGGKGLGNINFRVKEHLFGELSIETAPGSGTVVIIKMKV